MAASGGDALPGAESCCMKAIREMRTRATKPSLLADALLIAASLAMAFAVAMVASSVS